MKQDATPEERMIAVLREARELIARPENDFIWSSWRDAAAAIGEIDGYIERLRRGPVRKREMATMFAPTGPMQELAISSRWGEAFLDLAARFDDIAIAARHDWRCRLCAAVAGSIELSETGELSRESHTGRLTQPFKDPVAFARLWDAIASGGAAGVFAVDPELAPWWCPACAASYCGAHWETEHRSCGFRQL